MLAVSPSLVAVRVPVRAHRSANATACAAVRAPFAAAAGSQPQLKSAGSRALLLAAPRRASPRSVSRCVSATASAGTAQMHDFCMTFPYGFLVAVGGLLGFLAKGSVPSLVAGGGSGALLLLLGVLSLKAWKSGRAGASAPYTVASAAVAALLTFVMGKKFLLTRALFPPGAIAALSAAMLAFYAYNLLAGGNPKPAVAKGA